MLLTTGKEFRVHCYYEYITLIFHSHPTRRPVLATICQGRATQQMTFLPLDQPLNGCDLKKKWHGPQTTSAVQVFYIFFLSHVSQTLFAVRGTSVFVRLPKLITRDQYILKIQRRNSRDELRRRLKVIRGDKQHPSSDSNTETSMCLRTRFYPFFNRSFWSISSFVWM